MTYFLGILYATVMIWLFILVYYSGNEAEARGFQWDQQGLIKTETARSSEGEDTIIFYDRGEESPLYTAYFYKNSTLAHKLEIDYDRNGRPDVTLFDLDGDGYLNMEWIVCEENCEEVKERVVELWRNE